MEDDRISRLPTLQSLEHQKLEGTLLLWLPSYSTLHGRVEVRTGGGEALDDADG